ncbi:ATP-binding cassette sub-family A member 3-like protein [Leptotrombidium deliense]|uniref:ATP-binding cassette sub-family A member 3-like protein n=1 Tax=Leptotrombidium deliense TaxID=299467 RepID=A0A443SD80_9ACAR|nr:ATP-binding cassette sub-family A member 3-like protein [Leptotrombidium deliense]
MKIREISSNEMRNDSDFAAILFQDVQNAPDYQLDYVVRPVLFRETNTLYNKQKQPQLYKASSYNAYIVSGFVEIQMAVNIAFFATNNLIPAFLPPVPLPDINIFNDAPFLSAILIYYSAFIATVLPLMVFMKRVLDEKSSEIKKLLKLMAMREFEYWLSKIIFATLVFLLLNTVIVYFVYHIAGDRIDPSLLFVVLLIYFFSQLFLTMSISAFFKHAIFGIAAILAVQLLSSYPLWWFLKKPGVQDQIIRLFQGSKDLPEELYLLFCIIIPPNYSMLLSLFIIVEGSNYAYALEHLPHLAPYTPQWPNIFNIPPEYRIMSLGLIMCASIVGATMWLCVHLLLSTYIRSEDDIATEVNLWTKNEEPVAGSNEQMESMFEEEPKHLNVGIVIKNVTKTFPGNKIAVNNLSLNLYFGQITVLLGHNGAGKTTLMNMMTGLISPTSGSIVIDGFDITTDREKARRRLGLCPQREMLLENFTVEEHLYIFAILKGFPESNLKDEITNVLKLLNLSEKRKLNAKSLSGGMRRKLQFGIAIVGGCKILVLDEPSSGLDVESRRLIWDLLRSLRKGFLILMTTHHMEEADCLGDRIIIMADGQIKCSGSSSFLKQVFNVGHHLRILSESEDKKEIEHFVYENCSGVKLENETALELVFRIPPLKSAKLYSLCTLLESNKDSLRIQSFGLNMTSLDDVFLNSYHMFKKVISQFVAVNKLSFSVQKNEFFGFLGVNGAGKTTTFRMLTGDLVATSGNAYLSSYSLRNNFREYQQEIGYCPQQNVLLESLTGRQTLEFFARVRGISRKNLTKAVNEMLQCVDLEAYSEIATSVYSGGNVRKLALGIALIGKSQFLHEEHYSALVQFNT